MNYQRVLLEQLARDYSADADELAKGGCTFHLDNGDMTGRRRYGERDSFLKLVSTGSALAVSSQNEALLDWMRKHFDCYHEWISEAYKMYDINDRLGQYGHTLCDFHNFFLPSEHFDDRLYETERVCTVRLFRDDLGQFEGNPIFRESLAFNPYSPDMLAIAALDEAGTIIGTAGASADSPTMWQIGVNVAKEHRGHGIARYLVRLIKNEILSYGIVPFYGTANSHIASQRTALSCGFVPAWWEAYSEELEEE